MLEPVSNKIEKGIESQYFNIKYRPGLGSKNSKLDIQCSSLLTYLALADVYRNDRTFKNAKEQFYKALSFCQTEEELRNLDTFLKETAQMGGYAEQLYSEVSTLINVNGKQIAEQTLQREKEERQKPVSRRTPTGIESQYFSINFRPRNKSKNSKLSVHCSSLLTDLALADIYRDEQSFKKVEENLYKALLFCQTEEEIRELSQFIVAASDIGGYANQFHAEKATLISPYGKEKAEEYLQKSQERKEKPVSRRVDKGIESQYFDIEYRPGRKNHNFILEIEAASLLTYLALADIYRNEDTFAKAQEKLFQVLASCTTEKEVQELGTFLHIASDIGGYANKFYQENITRVRKGMPEVEQTKQVVTEQKVTKPKDETSIADFNRRYAEASERFKKAATASNLDDEEIAALLKEFNELQGELYDFNGKVAKEFISETDYELDKQIAWLRSAYQTIEELKATFNI